MSARDGGPAFPHQEHDADGGHYYDNPGMTLRDYFAAKALQGFAASESDNDGHWESEAAADRAYEWADAMLAAREVQS